MRYRRGDVVEVSLPKQHTVGHEEYGKPCRPCVVVNHPKASRYGLVAVVPITSQVQAAPLGSEVPITRSDIVTKGGEPGLKDDGVVLCDHLRFISPERIESPKGSTTHRRGAVSAKLRARIEIVITELLGLPIRDEER